MWRLLLVTLLAATTTAWLPVDTRHRRLPLHMGGGFGGNSRKQPSKKETKLKPKQQWDRFGELKTEKYRVAVRVDNGDWLEVGAVKSQAAVTTAQAVARQRALIAEHARRLFPLQISAKDTVEWAYFDADKWILVDKACLEEAPAGFEKQMGFEGRPDPASGYYCYYNAGRLVNGESDVPAPSKKLQ